MAFQDDYATHKARLAALAPYLTQNNTSVLMQMSQAFLSAIADTKVALANSAPGITYTTASGTALAIKAQDYNVVPSAGIAATANVVFFVQTAPITTINIPAGTVVGTGGNAVTTNAVNFTTLTACTISSGTTNTGAPVQVTCTQPGSIGNVAAGTITSTNLGQQGGIQVSNATTVSTISNPSGAGTGGVDPDTDPQIRAKVAVRATPLNGPTNAINAILAVSGVYDAYLFDPQLGSGFIYYYWCDSTGSASGISGGTPATSADGTYYISGPTLTGTALAVQTALTAALPVGIVARLGSYSGSSSQVSFQVSNLTSMTVHFYAPASVQTSVITPQIQTAIAAYFQGLTHGVAPTPAGIFNACLVATGYSISNLYVSASSPSLPSNVTTVANTLLWRATNPTITVVRDSS